MPCIKNIQDKKKGFCLTFSLMCCFSTNTILFLWQSYKNANFHLLKWVQARASFVGWFCWMYKLGWRPWNCKPEQSFFILAGSCDSQLTFLKDYAFPVILAAGIYKHFQSTMPGWAENVCHFPSMSPFEGDKKHLPMNSCAIYFSKNNRIPRHIGCGPECYRMKELQSVSLLCKSKHGDH